MAKITLDDETTAALTLFNEYVAADRERTQREKRLKKAERAKDDAAALVKKLSQGGSSTERSEAEAAYRAAAEKWKAMRDGKEPPADSPDPEATKSAEPEADAETETDTGADADAGADAQADADAEVDANAQGDDETATEPEPEPDAETAPEPEAEAEPEQEDEKEAEAE
ncbi:MAG: hypothetical protein F4098_14530 [Acidimicrobiaceae bacterium]|nr:hypothetical protein [Acidimicrobiaceae bacterium]